MNGKILVLGATGHVGSALVSQLAAAGERVKAASRNGTPVPGAESVRFDFADASTHAPALEGVERAFALVPTGRLDIVEILQPVIRAAAERKVKVVLQSVYGAETDEQNPYRQAERILERSGTPHVILRPNWFSDNFHTYWHHDVMRGVIAVPAGNGKSSFIDTRDIAACAAAALRSNRSDGRAFNLTGPEALSYSDAAEILSQVAGRPIKYTPVDDRTFVAALTAAGVSAAYAGLLAAIFHPVREGWTASVTPDVQELTGQPPRSLATYARDNTARFGN